MVRFKTSKKSETEALSSILSRVIKKYDIHPETFSAKKKHAPLFENWKTLIGLPICLHARPTRIQKGVLTISVDDSVLFHHLEAYGKKAMLETIQAKHADIKKIRFKWG
jgi:hypothetical protein